MNPNSPSTRRLPSTYLAAMAVLLGALVALWTTNLRADASSAKTSTRKAPAAILVASTSGGLVPVGFDIRSGPAYLVDSNVTFYAPGPAPAIYPGPALTPLFQRSVTKDEIASLDRAARAAGLNAVRRDWGFPQTADVPELAITYRGVTNTIPSFGVGEESLPVAVRQRRKAVSELLLSLNRGARPTTAVKADRIILFARQATADEVSADGIQPNMIDWPSSVTGFPFDGGCVDLQGKAGKTVGTLLQSATQLTLFRSGKYTYQVFARIGVPGDSGGATA